MSTSLSITRKKNQPPEESTRDPGMDPRGGHARAKRKREPPQDSQATRRKNWGCKGKSSKIIVNKNNSAQKLLERGCIAMVMRTNTKQSKPSTSSDRTPRGAVLLPVVVVGSIRPQLLLKLPVPFCVASLFHNAVLHVVPDG